MHDQVVQRIWNLCHILRGDGVSYHQYISELTYLLFLKISQNNGTEQFLPDGYRWADLVHHQYPDLLTFYRDMLTYLGGHAESETVREIYAFPTTVFSHSDNLRAVINGIDGIDWSSISPDMLGDIYEGLLAKNSQDARSGAGQYFTPRALIDTIVQLVQPTAEDLVQDPAAGSGGFLVAANAFVQTHDHSGVAATRPPTFEGMEIEKGTYRICLMNSFLHRLRLRLVLGDALTTDAAILSPATVILANPPFGSRSGRGRKQREDLPFTTANKQLAFLQHIYMGLAQGGRAAVVLPDNVLFEGGAGRRIRQGLMSECNLHTILRLPSGIFYAQNVMTNVLFFSRNTAAKEGTAAVWVYDMRTGMPSFGRKRQLTSSDFSDFQKAYGQSSAGDSKRIDTGTDGRFRCFSREAIEERDYNLDLSWLHGSSNAAADLSEPEDILARLSAVLRNAIEQVELLAEVIPSDEGQGI